jgi:hypothetical protein
VVHVTAALLQSLQDIRLWQLFAAPRSLRSPHRALVFAASGGSGAIARSQLFAVLLSVPILAALVACANPLWVERQFA